MIYIIELNIEFALKLKEKIRTTLDDKELESFACQIASGMVTFRHNTLFLELLIEGLQNLVLTGSLATCIKQWLLQSTCILSKQHCKCSENFKSATCFAKFQFLKDVC